SPAGGVTVSAANTTRQLAAGVLVWALHFTVLYSFTTVACARGFSAALPWVIGAATALAVGACLWLLASARRATGFEPWLAGAIAALALIAVLWQALPVVLVATPCD